MTNHPYTRSKPHQRWSSAMARPDPALVDPVVEMPFRIAPGQKVATAGSCFAQHIGRRLRAGGLDLLLAETAHPLLPPETAEAYGYDLYSARYGNIYSARQLLQLLRRAFGRFAPVEPAWQDEHGRWFDPFRPTVQPGGFATLREHDADRVQHLAAVRRMFETADVLVFTLGLTETWLSKEDGAAFPVCPGVAAGRFDPERHVFKNFDAAEVNADLRAFIEELRAVNPGVRLILTVSPVPLAATAEPRHVWTSTAWSKAVLRVAAEAVLDGDRVAYFPSYEIVTSPAARGAYFEPDLRSVTPEGVDHVMRLFFKHAVALDAGLRKPELDAEPPEVAASQAAMRAGEVICEEAMADFAHNQARSLEKAPLMSQASTLASRPQRTPLWGAVRKLFTRGAGPTGASVVAREASGLVGKPTGRPDWPPKLADPQPDWSDGLPTITPDRLSAEVLGGSILNHGSLLVRGLVDERGVKRLTDVLQRAFKAAEYYEEQRAELTPSADFTPYPLDEDGEMTEGGRLFVTRGGGVWTADSPAALEALIEELRRAGVVGAVEEYLGEPVFMSVGKSTLRCVPPTTNTGWHQDGAFLGPQIRTVNCWLALTDCGEDSPGLDVYPRRLNGLVETGTKDAAFDWSVGASVVDELAEGTTPYVAPRFRAGDALFFDQLFLHRTGVRPGMTKDRLAIETWLFAGSTFPMKQIPLSL